MELTYFNFQSAIFKDSELSSNAKLLGICIASHYNYKHSSPCSATDITLSRETGLSVSAITRAKRELRSNGYISTRRRFNESSLISVHIPSPRIALTEQCVVSEQQTDSDVLLSQSTRIALTEQMICSHRAINSGSVFNREKKAGLASSPATTSLLDDKEMYSVVSHSPFVVSSKTPPPLSAFRAAPGEIEEISQEAIQALFVLNESSALSVEETNALSYRNSRVQEKSKKLLDELLEERKQQKEKIKQQMRKRATKPNQNMPAKTSEKTVEAIKEPGTTKDTPQAEINSESDKWNSEFGQLLQADIRSWLEWDWDELSDAQIEAIVNRITTTMKFPYRSDLENIWVHKDGKPVETIGIRNDRKQRMIDWAKRDLRVAV
jgi:hypothetical protein